MTAANAAKLAPLPELDRVRAALENNAPLDGPLHVVACISNPCGYRRRYQLAQEFVERMEREEEAGRVLLYVAELVYSGIEGQVHRVASEQNPRHLRLVTAGAPLWHKENLLNVAVHALLPPDWKALAWIDMDVAFDSRTWAEDALRLLNGCFDVVQLFSHAEDLGPDGLPMKIFTGFGRERVRGRALDRRGGDRWHPGFAWACTRRAYDAMGGLYDCAVLGSGDNYMAMSLVGRARHVANAELHADVHAELAELQRRSRGLRLGYVPGCIRHYFHGTKAKRGYADRWTILKRHGFSPKLHLLRREDGLLEPNEACPAAMLDDIAAYFRSRDEDEYWEALA
jgi:hypothetical protein